MKTRRNVLLGVLLLAVAGLVLYRGLRPGPEASGGGIRLSGNIELRTVKLAFKVPGRLVRLEVEEGDPVQADQVVARLDSQELEQQQAEARASLEAARSHLAELEAALAYRAARSQAEIEQRQAELREARALLGRLEAGSREQEIQQARAFLEQMETQSERAAADWERARALFESQDISASQHDQYRATLRAAEASVRQAQQQLALLEEGPRIQDIEAARARLERARAGVAVAESLRLELEGTRRSLITGRAEVRRAEAGLELLATRLEDMVLRTPIGGVVLVKTAEAGEILAGGVAVVEIGDLDHPWLRGYIREEDLGRIRLGDRAEVRTDSFPGKVYPGRISFIASEAEFTPKQIQTPSERVRLVYRIKIELENPDRELKLNMPTDAEIRLREGGSPPPAALLRPRQKGGVGLGI